ncbi:hypothetical protein CU254_17805 [Amycolatopsis sp. AA4]|nr:hypothetical protein CU254_17805 [Amycolatopsis sp. AA4]EFL07827.1 predicted protein [Streptomyces sp. AA4]
MDESSEEPGNGRGWLKFAVAFGAVAVLGVVTVLVWPDARTLFRQSFTEQPETYTELYFVGTPAFRDGAVLAEVALVRHGPARADYTVVAALETSTADRLAGVSRRVTLEPGQFTAIDFRLPVPPGCVVDAIAVNVAGGMENLRFRLPGNSSGGRP